MQPNIQPKTFLKGRLYASNDPGTIPDAMANNFIVIALVDVGNSIQFPNCAIMSNLLPPPEAISAYLDGNPAMGMDLYMKYLMSPGREESVVCILAALYKKAANILLFTEYDSDQEFHILQTICSFLYNSFGIIVGQYKNPNTPAGIIPSPQYDFIISDLLFVNGHITKEEYSAMIPPDAMPSDRACSILLRFINYGFPDMNTCINACRKLINDIRLESQTGQISPLLIVKERIDQCVEDKTNRTVMGANTRFG